MNEIIMDILTLEECRTWCESNSIEVSASNRIWLGYGATSQLDKAVPNEEARGFLQKLQSHLEGDPLSKRSDKDEASIAIIRPEAAAQLQALSYVLLAYEDEADFSGALLWMTDWGIWSEESERPALRMWSQMRAGYGTKTELLSAPGHLFGSTEFIDLHAFFLLPILFQWDAYLVPNRGDYFIFVSHDGVIYTVARTVEVRDKLFGDYEYWKPLKRGRPRYGGV
jgi:hypothetical protein